MSNKDKFSKVENKVNNRNEDVNMVSKLLEKMLEEQDKKIKEIKVNMPINNNSRFSQTVQPKTDLKVNSVLKSMKTQVVIEDKNRLSTNSKIRSPTQKDLQISNPGNFPNLVERDSLLRESRGSPNNQSIRSSENYYLDDSNKANNSNQYNFVESKPYYTTNDKVRVTSGSTSSPQHVLKTYSRYKTIDTHGSYRNDRTSSDLKSPQLKNIDIDSVLSNEENLQYLLSNYQSKIADIVLQNMKNKQTRITETEEVESDREREPQQVHSVPNKRGGVVSFSNFSVPKNNTNTKKKNQELSDEIVIMENNELSLDTKEEEIIPSFDYVDSLWKRLKEQYYKIEYKEILNLLIDFILLKKQTRKQINIDINIPLIRKITKNERLIKKLIRIQRNIRRFLRRMRNLRDEKSSRILRKNYHNFFLEFKRILLRILQPNPLTVLKEYIRKIQFRDIMNNVICGKTRRFYFKKLLRTNKLYKILKNQLSICEKEQWTKYFYLWERRILLTKYTNSVNKIKSRWQIHRIKRKIKIIKGLKKIFITQKNLSIFEKLFIFAKLSKSNRIPDYISSLLLTLSKYHKKIQYSLKSVINEWNSRAQRIKYKNALSLIISLMRNNTFTKGKESYQNKVLMKNYIHGYVKKIKQICIDEMVKDNDSRLIAKRKFCNNNPPLITKNLISSSSSLERLLSNLSIISDSFNMYFSEIFFTKLKDKYRKVRIRSTLVPFMINKSKNVIYPLSMIKIIQRYFKKVLENARMKKIPKDKLLPINITMPLPYTSVKRYILKPTTPVSVINNFIGYVVDRKTTKIKKLNKWYTQFLKRNCFKTLRTVIPRSNSINIMKLFSQKRLMHYYFDLYRRTSWTLGRILFIKRNSYSRKIQNRFRNYLNKIRFYHKLYLIVNGVHRHVIEKLQKRFIQWIRLLNFTKLSKAIKLIIQLMRENTHFKSIHLVKEKVYNLAEKRRSYFIKDFIQDLILLSGLDNGKQRISSFLRRITYKYSYRFINIAKDNAKRSNKFFQIVDKLYNNYEKNLLSFKFRHWFYSNFRNKIILNDSVNMKSFFSHLNNKECKLFLFNMRILTAKELKLKEYLLKYLRNVMFARTLSLWYNHAISFKKYKDFSNEFNKLFNAHNLRHSLDKISMFYLFKKKLNNLNDSIKGLIGRSNNYYFKAFLDKLREINSFKSKDSHISLKSDKNKISAIRYSQFQMQSFSNKVADTASKAEQDIQQYRVMSEFLNAKYKEIHKANLYDFFSRVKLKSLNEKTKRVKVSNIEKLQNLSRKFKLFDDLKSLRTVRDRIKNIDLLITSKSKILNNTKKFVFAVLFKTSLRLNKQAKFLYDYLNEGLGTHYMPTISENCRILNNPSAPGICSEREMLLRSYQKVKNNISYYSPGENLYIRNIYSYKWWEGQVIKPQERESSSNTDRNIFKYLEGFSMNVSSFSDRSIQQLDGITLINDSRRFKSRFSHEKIVNYQIIGVKDFKTIVDKQPNLFVAPLPKVSNQVFFNSFLQVTGKVKPLNYINQTVDINIEGCPKPDKIIILKRFEVEDAYIQNENNLFIYQVPRLLHNILYSSIETNNNIEILRPAKELFREFQSIFTINREPKPENLFEYINNFQILQEIPRNYLISSCNSLEIMKLEKSPNYINYVNSIFIQGDEPEVNFVDNVNCFQIISREPTPLFRSSYSLCIQGEEPEINYVEYANGFHIKAQDPEPLYRSSCSFVIHGEVPPDNYVDYVNGFHIRAQDPEPLYSSSYNIYIQGEEPEINYVDYVNGFHIKAQDPEPLYSSSYDVYIQGEVPPANYVDYVNGFHIRAQDPEPLYSSSYNIYIQGEEPEINYVDYVNGFHIKAQDPEPLYSSSYDVYIQGEVPPANYVDYVNSIQVNGKQREVNRFENVNSLQISRIPREENQFEKVNNFLIFAEDKEENVLQYLNNFQINGYSRFRNLTKNILEIIEIKALKKQITNIVQTTNDYSILQFPPEIPPLSKQMENNIQIIQIPKPKPVAIQRVNPIQIIREKKKDFAKQKTFDFIIKAKVKPSLSVSAATRIVIPPKPKDNTKIIAKNSFTINRDEDVRIRLIRESERKIKESYRFNWIDSQKVRQQENLLIKPRPRNGLVIENSIFELFESRKPLEVKIIEEGIEDANSDHLRESVASNDNLKLRVSIRKKEAPKNDHKYDVINKLGAKRSKTILGDIFNNLGDKKEEIKLADSIGSKKEELLTLESKKDSVMAEKLFRDDNIQANNLFNSKKESQPRVDFQGLSNKEDIKLNFKQPLQKDSGINRMYTTKDVFKRSDTNQLNYDEENSMRSSKKDVTKVDINDLIKKTVSKENAKEPENLKNKVGVVTYSNLNSEGKKTTTEIKSSTSNSKLSVLKPNNKNILTNLVKRKTTKTEELILREETETNDLKFSNIKTPK